MKTLALATLLLSFSITAHAATINNDSSCDISVLPAATLLLPYFEVDLEGGQTTIFTITNTSRLPQIAHVTLWTDYDYPVVNFNIFLTGYDVQSINLYDVIGRGLIAPNQGTGYDRSPVGELSGDVDDQETFDNPVTDEQSCRSLPGRVPQGYVIRMQSAFTLGKVSSLGTLPACNTVGGVHEHAVGYATVDVVGECHIYDPTSREYYSQVIRFDNVLAGDYMQVDGEQNYAQGGPMVHIRAIPEGGTPQERAEDPDYEVDLPRTFYSRYQTAASPVFDARQPLPATFGARWISRGPTTFETYYKIWREGRSPADTPCSALPAKAFMNMVEVVRFDEEENPESHVPEIIICTPILPNPVLPVTSLVSAEDTSVFPENTQDAVAGWMYMNLDYCNRDTFAGQNWVVTSMRAEGRFSVDIDALALGNGCSLPIASSEASSFEGDPIGPAPNVRP